MDVRDGHPGAIATEVDVLGDELWLFRLDEVGEVFEARLQLVERPLGNLRDVDVHDHVGHSTGTRVSTPVVVRSGATVFARPRSD
jgi:hypothetical protein